MNVIFLAFNMTPLPNGQFTNVSSKNRLRIFSRIQMVANIFSWLCQKHFFFSTGFMNDGEIGKRYVPRLYSEGKILGLIYQLVNTVLEKFILQNSKLGNK